MELEWKYSGSVNYDGNTSEGNGPYKPPYKADMYCNPQSAQRFILINSYNVIV